MALVKVIPKKPAIFPGGFGNPFPPPIVFDAATVIDHQRSTSLTDTPIEVLPAPTGSAGQITDHAQKDPMRCSAQLVISSHPDDFVPNVIATRPTRVWRQLEQLWASDAIVDFVTSDKIYTTMAIVQLGLPKTLETSHTYVIPLVFRKIEIAGVDVAQQMADAAAEIALGVEDIGAQAASVAVTAASQSAGSISFSGG